MKLAKCPLCGERSEHNRDTYGMGVICYTCMIGADTPREWNRLARLVRKGRMFEWLERSGRTDYGRTGFLWNAVCIARDWWRNREKGGG